MNDYVRARARLRNRPGLRVPAGKVYPWARRRRGLVHQHGRAAAQGDDEEPQPAGADHQRLLRHGDALFRRRLHGGSHGPPEREPRAHPPDLLRSRPHDVHPPGRPRQAQERHRGEFWRRPMAPGNEIAPGVGWLQLPIVNVYFAGRPGGGPWVLVDTGLPGSGAPIRRAAEALFGDRPPEAIVLTHGHFDHRGAAAELAGSWDVPIYAHRLELPYLTGRSDYPPPGPHGRRRFGHPRLTVLPIPRGRPGAPAARPAGRRRDSGDRGLALDSHPGPRTGPHLGLPRVGRRAPRR